MDAYNKLSEVGVVLYQSARYKMCIQILETAQRFQTNQKGITMRVLLTLANAQSKQGNRSQAISLYQECLALAVATHEQVSPHPGWVSLGNISVFLKLIYTKICRGAQRVQCYIEIAVGGLPSSSSTLSSSLLSSSSSSLPSPLLWSFLRTRSSATCHWPSSMPTDTSAWQRSLGWISGTRSVFLCLLWQLSSSSPPSSSSLSLQFLFHEILLCLLRQLPSASSLSSSSSSSSLQLPFSWDSAVFAAAGVSNQSSGEYCHVAPGVRGHASSHRLLPQAAVPGGWALWGGRGWWCHARLLDQRAPVWPSPQPQHRVQDHRQHVIGHHPCPQIRPPGGEVWAG